MVTLNRELAILTSNPSRKLPAFSVLGEIPMQRYESLPIHDPARTFLLEQFFALFVIGAIFSTEWSYYHSDSTTYAHVRLPGVTFFVWLMGVSVIPALIQLVLNSVRIVAFSHTLLIARSTGLLLLFGTAMTTAGIAGAFRGQLMGRTVAFTTVAIFAAIAFLRIQFARRSG